MSNTKGKHIFRYRLSPETFGYSLVLEWILEKQDGNVWTGCIWLRIWTSGRILWTW